MPALETFLTGDLEELTDIADEEEDELIDDENPAPPPGPAPGLPAPAPARALAPAPAKPQPSAAARRKPRAQKQPKWEYTLQNTLSRSRTTTYSVEHIYRLIHNGEIDLNPEYQRHVVWTDIQQGALIHSILHGFPVPPLLFVVRKGSDLIEQRTCIDGKQRLTSILRYMDAEIPFRDPYTGDRIWFKQPATATKQMKLKRKVLPERLVKYLQTQQITCVEYADLTLNQEREIFRRVQEGKALTPSERIRALPGVLPDFVRMLRDIAFSDTDVFHNLEVECGVDFQAVASAVMLAEQYPAIASYPTITKLEAFLGRHDGVSARLERGLSETFRILRALADDAAHAAAFQDALNPLEFAFAALLVFVRRKQLAYAQLADAILELRTVIHKQYANNERQRGKIAKRAARFIADMKPVLQGQLSAADQLAQAEPMAAPPVATLAAPAVAPPAPMVEKARTRAKAKAKAREPSPEPEPEPEPPTKRKRAPVESEEAGPSQVATTTPPAKKKRALQPAASAASGFKSSAAAASASAGPSRARKQAPASMPARASTSKPAPVSAPPVAAAAAAAPSTAPKRPTTALPKFQKKSATSAAPASAPPARPPPLVTNFARQTESPVESLYMTPMTQSQASTPVLRTADPRTRHLPTPTSSAHATPTAQTDAALPPVAVPPHPRCVSAPGALPCEDDRVRQVVLDSGVESIYSPTLPGAPFAPPGPYAPMLVDGPPPVLAQPLMVMSPTGIALAGFPQAVPSPWGQFMLPVPQPPGFPLAVTQDAPPAAPGGAPGAAASVSPSSAGRVGIASHATGGTPGGYTRAPNRGRHASSQSNVGR